MSHFYTNQPTPYNPEPPPMLTPEQFREIAFRLESEVANLMVGQQEVVRAVLTCMIAGGHALLEGVPGLGKTMLVRTLAEALDLEVQPHPVHARPDARRHHRHERHRRDDAGRRSLRVPARPDLREHRPRRRDQPRHAEDAVRAARSDAGAHGHRRATRSTSSTSRSSSSRRRTRSRWRAPIRCPKRSSTASSSSCSSASRTPRSSSDILDRTTGGYDAAGATRSSTGSDIIAHAATWRARCPSPRTCRTTRCSSARDAPGAVARAAIACSQLRPLRRQPARRAGDDPRREDSRAPRRPLRRRASTTSAPSPSRRCGTA